MPPACSASLTNLVAILMGRHKDLAHLRTLPEKRRKSLIRGKRAAQQHASACPARILHIESNKLIAEAVRDALEGAGCEVVTCAGRGEAARILGSDEPFDLVIYDNELSGQSGVELIQYGRSLAHRERAPFVIFSAGDVESQARGAGADAFLRKPEELGNLVATVTRLLSKRRASS